MSIDLSQVAYISMSGAQAQSQRMRTIAENLANIQSIGYRAQVTGFQENSNAQSPFSDVLVTNQYTNFKTGAFRETGKSLDLAIEQSQAFFVVLAQDGTEGMTRNGAFKIDSNGQLKTLEDEPVLGDGGPLFIPPNSKITIARDGTVTATDIDSPTFTRVVGKIRLVSVTDLKSLRRSDDGLFRSTTGLTPPPDSNVFIRQGFLEGSNVSAPHELTEMITNARVFEYQMRIIHELSQNRQSANQLLSMNHS